MNREIKFRGFQKSWIFGGVTISVTDCTGKKEKALLLW